MIRKLTMATTFSLLLGLAPSLSAAPRVPGRPAFGFGYWYPAPVYRAYPAPWYPTGWYPGHGRRVVVVAPATGELKLNTNDKDARVYVDGGYLGIARKLKKFDLEPGDHEIELRDAS